MISIIIPCMNSMPFIKFAVESIYASTQFPFRMILIDGESTDGTKEYLDTLKDVEVYHIPRKGLTNAINYGIKKAGRDDVYLTHDDVIHYKLLGRDWLGEMNEIAKKPKVGQITTLGGYGRSTQEYFDNMLWVGTWSNYIPRRTIDKIGLFDEDMQTGDDIDYSYRISKTKKHIGIIDYWVQHHRLTNHGNVDDEDIKAKMGEYFRKKHKINGNIKKGRLNE